MTFADSVAEWMEALNETSAELPRLESRVAEARFGDDSPLLDRRFLDRAPYLCARFLNPGAHPEGLTRERCQELRQQLLEGGFLRELLAAIQPRR